MNLPGASWTVGAGATVCTRRSRRKEGVRIQRENHTLASITFQNYFRMREKLSGIDR